MAACALDALLYALRHAVEAANESLRARRDAIRAGDAAEGHALRVDVPADPSPDAPLESVVIPMAMFRDRGQPHVSLMSLEFDCLLRYRRPRRGDPAELIVELGRRRRRWFSRERAHRLRITYRAVDAWRPRVELDGRVVAFPSLTGD
ncbi:hypothetical protein L2Y94_18805 [Luteibacter aegosomatis]|uniref:hypothetical protein n=1 Tax=Luteibacter aegosomatis TaxID=2911537 RepID=UPI001FFB501E|nr:hypothetical protein [Luteibacter aegosomatis]UPG85330.1 hypothetical protein L2Y94_18805 [Luteibacter aegosomatis]